MRTLARITSVVFVGLGLLIILAGIVVTLSGFFGEQPSVSTPALMPDLSGLVIVMSVFGGAAISLQGFFLAAIGQGIWLLVDIAGNTEASSTYFTALMRKNAAGG
jgi:hypothetical protein